MEQPNLLEDILTMDDKENCNAVNLVNLYKDLLLIGKRLKSGVQEEIDKEVKKRERECDGEEEEEEEEQEEEEEEEEEDEYDSEDENVERITKKKTPKSVKPGTPLEELLRALDLHKQQKQHLLIKRAILLKFEEALFGNNNITMTVDLRQMGEEEKDGKLEEILECKDLTKYMPKTVTENGASLEFAEKAALRDSVSVAKSPPDILKPFKSKTPKKIAVNLIKQQYNIRWNTESGESKPFDFFELPKHFCKGIVRKMHIQTTLFEHKADIINIPSTLKVTGSVANEDICPPFIYIKKDPYANENDDSDPKIRARDEPKFSWQRWSVQGNECTELGFEFPIELKWIDPKVKILIRKLCQPINNDFNVDMPNVMYMLVVNDTTSTKLSDFGNRSQVYIGGADNGVKNKFLDGDGSHCNRVIELYKHFSNVETFTPNTSALLVEMRLLLAIARRENYALFALNTFGEPRVLGKELHDLVIQVLILADNEIWGPAVNMRFGLNLKEELNKRRKFLPKSFPGSNRKRHK